MRNKINWGKLQQKQPEFCIDSVWYNEYCMKFSHKNEKTGNFLFYKNIQIDIEIWKILSKFARNLENIIRNYHIKQGIKKYNIKFEAFSFMATKDGYEKAAHIDAAGYLPCVALLYLDFSGIKKLGFELFKDYDIEHINPNMSIQIKNKNKFIIFFGFFGDILKHAPIGKNKQNLVTFRGVCKTHVLIK